MPVHHEQGQGRDQREPEEEINEDTIPPITTAFWEQLESLLHNVPVEVVRDRLVDARIQRQAREHVQQREQKAPLPPRWTTRRRSA